MDEKLQYNREKSSFHNSESTQIFCFVSQIQAKLQCQAISLDLSLPAPLVHLRSICRQKRMTWSLVTPSLSLQPSFLSSSWEQKEAILSGGAEIHPSSLRKRSGWSWQGDQKLIVSRVVILCCTQRLFTLLWCAFFMWLLNQPLESFWGHKWHCTFFFKWIAR